jgi:hypothetical protein
MGRFFNKPLPTTIWTSTFCPHRYVNRLKSNGDSLTGHP